MFPLDSDFLLYVKFFIFLTCVFFWVKLGYDAFRRSTRLRHRHRSSDDD